MSRSSTRNTRGGRNNRGSDVRVEESDSSQSHPTRTDADEMKNGMQMKTQAANSPPPTSLNPSPFPSPAPNAATPSPISISPSPDADLPTRMADTDTVTVTVTTDAQPNAESMKQAAAVAVAVPHHSLAPSASPTSTVSTSSSSDALSPPPATAAPSSPRLPASVDADTVVESSDGSGHRVSESKFDRLHNLLDQTSLFAKFLSERMPARYASTIGATDGKAADTAKSPPPTAGSKSRAEVIAERGAELHRLLPNDGRDRKTGEELKLHNFQIVGIDWLISLYENGLNGILADEMGLGKTLQVIMFLAHLRAHRVFGPFLVVAPLGTLASWKSEMERWTSIPALLYHGSKAERSDTRKMLGSSHAPDKTFPVILTSFEIAMRDASWLRRTNWKLLIVDEGHRLKNLECALLMKLKSFPSENRLLLSGTPLQNSLKELWSLLHFLLPDLFSSLAQFQSWFDFDASSNSDDRSLETTGGQQYVINAERDNRLISKLHTILRPFVLRRVKADVLSKMATKREYVIYCPLTPLQRMYYKALLDGELQYLRSSSSVGGMRVQNTLMQLRKVCNHPYLLIDDEEEIQLGIDMDRQAKLQLFGGVNERDEESETAPSTATPSRRSRPTRISAPSSSTTQPLPTLSQQLISHLSQKKKASSKSSSFIVADNEALELIDDEEEEEAEVDSEEERKERMDDGDYEERKRKRKGKGRKSTGRRSAELKIDAGDNDEDEDVGFETITQRNKRRRMERESAAASSSASSIAASATPLASVRQSIESNPTRLIDVCGKLQFIDQLLPELHRRGSKVLIFSHMTRVLDLLEDYLSFRQYTCGWFGGESATPPVRIDGSTPQTDRVEAINTFSEEPTCFVFLLSTRAGGLGLNLSAADTVILYDSGWNPHDDIQASDRAHRLTQRKPVLIFRLLSHGSVEMSMRRRASSKKTLEQLVLTKGKFNKHQIGGGTSGTAQALEEAAAATTDKAGNGIDERKQGDPSAGTTALSAEASKNAAATASFFAWRTSAGIVNELVELFRSGRGKKKKQKQKATSQEADGHEVSLSDTEGDDTFLAQFESDAKPPPHLRIGMTRRDRSQESAPSPSSTRGTTRGGRGKKRTSTGAARNNSSTTPSDGEFDHGAISTPPPFFDPSLLDRLLDRSSDHDPPSDALPRSAFEPGYELVESVQSVLDALSERADPMLA